MIDFLQGRAMNTMHHERTSGGASRLAPVMAMFFLFMGSAFAGTEGPKQKFVVRDAEGGDHGTYTTQAEAEAAIKTIPGPKYQEDAYQYADTIKSSVVREDGATLITYWLGREKAKDEDWVYTSGNVEKIATEQEAYALLEQRARQKAPQCGSPQIVPRNNWGDNSSGPYPQYDVGYEMQARQFTVNAFFKDCSDTYAYGDSISRKRRTECARPYTQWHISDQGCTNKVIFATIEVSTLQCGDEQGKAGNPVGAGNSGLVGNPCD
ncbi:hypothetical protein, partial [Xanthomonas sontii]